MIPTPLKKMVFSLAAILLLTAGSAMAGGAYHKVPKQDIVDAAAAAGDFSTLATAIQAADLVSTLKGEGPYTVFAPTDEAFARLPEGQLDSLLKDKEKLANVLTYHVVPGKLMSADVVKVEEAATVQGQSLKVDTSEGVKVDGATVIKADIVASNGVIHAIDTVLIPN